MRSVTLLVPSPADPQRLDRFVVANVSELSRRQVKGLINAGKVKVQGRLERRAGRHLKPGETVSVEYRPSWSGQALPAALRVVHQGQGWLAIDKPSGVASHDSGDHELPSITALLDADSDPERRELRPIHRLDRSTSGLLLLAAGTHRAELSALFAQRSISKEYLAVVHPAPKKAAGKIDGPTIEGKPCSLSWQLLRTSQDGSRAELLVRPDQGRWHQVRIQLSAAGHPLIGDMEHGHPVPGGAPRLALHAQRLSCDRFDISCPPPPSWEDLLEPSTNTAEALSRATSSQQTAADSSRRQDSGNTLSTQSNRLPSLRISRASARILAAGHPWLIQDRWTGDLSGLQQGQPIRLFDEKDRFVATALADPERELCAWVLSRRPAEEPSPELWVQRAAAAIERRSELLNDPGCNALRLIHGAADGFPGLSIDLWGELLVATLRSPALRTMATAAYQGLRNQLGERPLLERDHFTDLRTTKRSNARLTQRWIDPPTTELPSSWWVQEAELSYLVSPLQGLSSGLYPDQRSNRALLSALLKQNPGGQVANLFSHTGAFSVACAAAGAERVWSIDLSRPWSEVARRNLQQNQISEQDHPVITASAHAWLESHTEPLAGIILDPPSRSSGARRDGGWSSRKDYKEMIRLAATRLRPGGWMLCCSNLKGVRNRWLQEQIQTGITAAGRAVIQRRNAPPSPDFPTLKGFPEGRSFQASLVWLDE